MDKKEINITIPEGYEIDRENSTFEHIVLKKIEPKRWRDDENAQMKGFVIREDDSKIVKCLGYNYDTNHNIFATEKDAKSALAMAYISQIMKNDERFGGVVTDREWEDSTTTKYVIYKSNNKVISDFYTAHYHFLAFHTKEQRNLFLQENMDLVKEYLMIE